MALQFFDHQPTMDLSLQGLQSGGLRLEFAFELFCPFSIFANRPSRRDLIDFFGRDRAMDIDRALQRLLQQGFISKEGESNIVLAEKDRFLHFFVGESHSHLDVIQAGFLISVNKAQYQETLQQLKQDVRKTLVAMETPDADMLVRFNLRIFSRYEK